MGKSTRIGVCLLIFACACALQAGAVSVALLDIENRSADPRYDYLAGIVKGLLLFDLSAEPGVELVDRGELESILAEQELRLSSITEDTDKSLRIGKILGADQLLKGEYVFLGSEILLSVTLLDVTSARSVVFSDRGSTENLVHGLAEQLIRRLTGKQVRLQSEQRERSILSMQDETPGTIALHTHLVDAEIYLDEEFVGYSTGDARIPYLLEDVAPGPHRLRLHLQNFGVVKEPEITFHDWEQEVAVKPGKRHVVRAGARHFNSIIYDLMQVVREDMSLRELAADTPLLRRHEFAFVSREGESIAGTLEIKAVQAAAAFEVKVLFTLQGAEYRFTLGSAAPGNEIRQEFAPLELRVEVEADEVSYAIWRRDIRQNMFYDR
jgi:hypothetical protein